MNRRFGPANVPRVPPVNIWQAPSDEGPGVGHPVMVGLLGPILRAIRGSTAAVMRKVASLRPRRRAEVAY